MISKTTPRYDEQTTMLGSHTMNFFDGISSILNTIFSLPLVIIAGLFSIWAIGKQHEFELLEDTRAKE